VRKLVAARPHSEEDVGEAVKWAAFNTDEIIAACPPQDDGGKMDAATRANVLAYAASWLLETGSKDQPPTEKLALWATHAKKEKWRNSSDTSADDYSPPSSPTRAIAVEMLQQVQDFAALTFPRPDEPVTPAQEPVMPTATTPQALATQGPSAEGPSAEGPSAEAAAPRDSGGLSDKQLASLRGEFSESGKFTLESDLQTANRRLRMAETEAQTSAAWLEIDKLKAQLGLTMTDEKLVAAGQRFLDEGAPLHGDLAAELIEFCDDQATSPYVFAKAAARYATMAQGLRDAFQAAGVKAPPKPADAPPPPPGTQDDSPPATS
jgi:hypothetical protein